VKARPTASSSSLESVLDSTNYFLCGVVEVRGLEGVLGMVCGHPAKTLCYDCGASLCPVHAERCDLCAEDLLPVLPVISSE